MPAKAPSGKRSTVPLEVGTLAAAAAALSLLEAALVLAKALPPVLSYSPGNLLFTLARLAVVAYAGVAHRDRGLKEAAVAGGMIALAGSGVLCLAALASAFTVKIPVLGLQTAGTASLLFTVLLVLAQNAVIGAALAAFAAWLAGVVKRS